MRHIRRKRNHCEINRNSKQFNIKIMVIMILFFAFLIFSTFFALVHSINTKMIGKVKINGSNVSNLTIEEAYQKLNTDLKEKKENAILLYDGEHEVSISLEQLEVTYNIEEAVNEAYRIGRNSNIIVSNYQIIFTSIFGKNIEKDININETQLNKIIEDMEVKLPDTLQESSYYIEGEQLIISKGKAGKVLEKDKLKEEIVHSIQKQIRGETLQKIMLPVKIQEPTPIKIQEIAEEIQQEPKDAYYEKEPFQLYKEIEGIQLAITQEEVEKILAEEKEEYYIPLKITKPNITINDLKYEDFFPNQLAKFSTRFSEINENRVNNMKLSSEKINGTILMPGETFSYNKIVGERTIKAGYKEAAVYMNGKVVNGIGGGICQVSSTLYNAALEANLEIISRRNHYFITSYVSPSRDATVSYGTIDFKFKNNRSYPIKIGCSSKNGICLVEIHGIYEETEYEVEIQDQVTEVIPYTTRYIDTEELNKGEEQEVQKGVNGYKSEAYKVVKLKGAVISKTLLSKDSYNPLQRIVKRGTK